jgi:hypothetical protein
LQGCGVGRKLESVFEAAAHQAVRDKRQYPNYGFVCDDVNGTYRLEPKL